MRALAIMLTVLPLGALAKGGPAPLKPTSTYDAWVAECAPKHGHGKIKAVERLADGKTVQGTFKDGHRVLFTELKGTQCERVFPIGRAAGRVRGRFDASGGVFKAFLMSQFEGSCVAEEEGGCLHALVLKHRDGSYRAALEIGQCPRVEMRTVKLFDAKTDAVVVKCSSPGGGDMWAHSEGVYAERGGQLHKMLWVAQGHSSTAIGAAEVATRPDGGARCEYQPPGGFEVVKVGPKPEVVVKAANFDTPGGKLKRSRLVWDGQRMVAAGAPVEVAPDQKIVCHDDVP